MMNIRQLADVIDDYNNSVPSAVKKCLFVDILGDEYRLYCSYDLKSGTECRFYKSNLKSCGKDRCFAWTV